MSSTLSVLLCATRLRDHIAGSVLCNSPVSWTVLALVIVCAGGGRGVFILAVDRATQRSR